MGIVLDWDAMGEPIALPRFAGCTVCGDPSVNPKSLDLQCYYQDGVVTATFTPSDDEAGFPGTIHGGVLTSLLDEVSVWASSIAADAFCVTRDLRTRYLKPARPGVPLSLEARVSDEDRLITVEARAVSPEGDVVAQSTGRFYPAFRDEWDDRVRNRIALDLD